MSPFSAYGRLLAAAAALSLPLLACNFGLGGPTPPPSPIAVSTEAAGELEQMIGTAVAGAVDGQVSLVITEQQLTSYVAVQLEKDPDSAFSDVQITLRDGRIVIFANAAMGAVAVPVQMAFVPSTTSDGRLAIALDEAGFGPVPVPASVLNSLSEGINEAVAGQFGPQVTGFRITQVTIADGQMALTGDVTR
jgi:hypothetical protein